MIKHQAQDGVKHPAVDQTLAGPINRVKGNQRGRRACSAERTIKAHRGQVTRKMGTESMADLVRMAATLGIHGPTSQG